MEQETLTRIGLGTPPPLYVESEVFSGSLVLLFHLAREGKVNLAEVPLSPLCEAYLEYLKEIAFEDVEHAGAALFALAYLVERKAWALLPIADPPPPEEPPILPEPTVEEYNPVIEQLVFQYEDRSKTFFRTAPIDKESFEPPIELGNVSIDDLAKAFEKVLARAKPVEVEKLARPRPTLSEVMGNIMRTLRQVGKGGFETILPENYTRFDAVFVFLGVLELIRIGKLHAELKDGEVWFRVKES
ncbi:MAG TPA: segregation/condensation protein A [Fimbriimonadales bacterium]|nr:segregation/condensation protein A [Fimbriimonadales bacterium]